jgi:hypothetical protein
MKNYKNYLIALLTGLLVLTLTTQPSIGAGKSKEAKMIEYDNCIRIESYRESYEYAASYYITKAIKECKVFQP